MKHGAPARGIAVDFVQKPACHGTGRTSALFPSLYENGGDPKHLREDRLAYTEYESSIAHGRGVVGGGVRDFDMADIKSLFQRNTSGQGIAQFGQSINHFLADVSFAFLHTVLNNTRIGDI